MYIPATMSRFSWNRKGHQGSFSPRGNPRLHGLSRKAPRKNPFDSLIWETDKEGVKRRMITYAARIIVGLRIGDTETQWREQELIRFVKKLRNEQTGDPSMSIVSQRGIYKHSDGGPIIEEDSLQIIIFDTSRTAQSVFESQICSIGEEICKKFRQESVIVELQEGGVPYDLGLVRP